MRGQLSYFEYPRPTDNAQQSQQKPPAEENAAESILCIKESFKNQDVDIGIYNGTYFNLKKK